MSVVNLRPEMKVISNIEQNKDLIISILKKHGCSAEHNYYCYKYNLESSEEPYVFLFEDCEQQYCILSKYDKSENNWYFVVEPVAPDSKKIRILIEAINYVFSRNAKKIWLELESKTRRLLLQELRNSPLLKVNKINYTLIWPVFDMTKWCGDKMEGKEWKDIRYYWNKFFKEHKVEFVTADKVDKNALKNLVIAWKKKRKTGDRAYIDYYLNAIDKGFEGYDFNRIMLVDGEVASITAGFVSRPSYYYSSIGLYNKDIDRCNEIANMDDLITLKKSGFQFVDFGGQERKSLDFKKKFRPTYYYKTHVFSIVKR